MEEIRAKGYAAAHSRHVSTTKKVYVPAGMVVDPRRGEGWAVEAAPARLRSWRLS